MTPFHNPARMRGVRTTTAGSLGERAQQLDEDEARQTAGTLRRARETQGRALMNQIRSSYQGAQETGDFSEYNRLVAARRGFQTDERGDLAFDENGSPLGNEFGKMGEQLQDINRGLRPELTQEKLDQDRAHLGGQLQQSRRKSAAMMREQAGGVQGQIDTAKSAYGDRAMAAEGYDLPGERARSGPSMQDQLTAPGLYDQSTQAERERFGFDQIPGLTQQRDQLQLEAANMEDAAQYGELMARDGEQVFPASMVDIAAANRRRNAARDRATAAQGERMEREQLDAGGRQLVRDVERAGQSAAGDVAEAARVRAANERTLAGAESDAAATQAINSRIGRTVAEGTEGDRIAAGKDLQSLEDRLAKAKTSAELETALADAAEATNRQIEAKLAQQNLNVGDPGNVLMARAPEIVAEGIEQGVAQIVAAFTKGGKQAGGDSGLIRFGKMPVAQVHALKTTWMPKLMEAYESGDPVLRQQAMDVATAVYGQLEALRTQTGSGSFEGRRTVGLIGEFFRGDAAFDVSAPDPNSTDSVRAGEAIDDLNRIVDQLGLIAGGARTPGVVRASQARRRVASETGAS